MKSLVPTNLITIVSDTVLIKGLLFPWQSQWNYDRIEKVSCLDTVTKHTQAGTWTFTNKGTVLVGVTVDGVFHEFPQEFEHISDNELEIFSNWLKQFGNFSLDHDDKDSTTIQLACSLNNGSSYVFSFDESNDLETSTTTCTYTTETLNCCKQCGNYYVVIVDEEEYWIYEEDAVQCAVVNNQFLGQSVYKEKVASEWPDKEEKDMLHPDPCKILERANRVIDPPVRYPGK